MKKFGPVHPGTPEGDFGTAKLGKTEGGLVTGNYIGMYIYVHPDELKLMPKPKSPWIPDDFVIGLCGRSKRQKDSEELKIIHIES
jgi:hypothetical protein